MAYQVKGGFFFFFFLLVTLAQFEVVFESICGGHREKAALLAGSNIRNAREAGHDLDDTNNADGT